MNRTNLKKAFYHFKHRYVTTNNIVVVVGFMIAASWAWGAISSMQQNYQLQREVDARRRELELGQLEVGTLQYQQNYYRSDEYKDLQARERLGLAAPGEKALILPPNSAEAIAFDQRVASVTPRSEPGTTTSNFEQWMNFLLGENVPHLQK